MHVCEYMTSNPVTVTPQSTALEAAEKMYGGLERFWCLSASHTVQTSPNQENTPCASITP